jgi:DNA-directed RNA polymerase subunit RPC12/RpoP
MEREKVDKCPNCGSSKIDPGEYWYKYGTDRYLICHSCGQEVDNSTADEKLKDQQLKDEWWRKHLQEQREKEYALYLKLKKKFEV